MTRLAKLSASVTGIAPRVPGKDVRECLGD